MTSQERTAFFFEHAGWSHPAGADEAGQLIARHDNARQLAEAEEIGARRGWWFGVEDDYDDCADGDAGELIEAGTHQRLLVYVSDSSSRVLASLGSVIVERETDPYVRVVAAEMMSELLATHEACRDVETDTRGTRVTCGSCGHAWCERCDPAPSALCHWCHGRGYSTAEMQPADPWADVETVERGPRDRVNTYRGKVTR